jgi:hypothetical protein
MISDELKAPKSNGFAKGKAIAQCHLGMLPEHGDIGGDGMDSLLECLVPEARGFLLLYPIMADA